VIGFNNTNKGLSMTAKARKQKYPQPVPAESAGQAVKIKHQIKPKNYSQELYLESLREQPLTICSGPAGSGKTYLVTSVAVEKLISNEVDRVVITRPVVEAGEHLGFLPGTLEEKLDPYLLPLIDAIEDHIGPIMTKKLLESGKIEIAPLAFMRGRTFNNCFVILDEAQNATTEQMKMFVTRMGYDSVFAINGDTSQSDLQKPKGAGADWENGLQYIIRKLKGRDEKINYIEFQNRDVVRSAMVQRILNLLDAPDQKPTTAGTNGYSRRNGNGAYHSVIDGPTGTALHQA
jgi:phosphate starvation-inducible PhoH-like protein